MIKARYTVVLKTLLDDPEIAPLIHKAMSSYPLYEKKSKEEFIPSVVPTRSELNQKILDYYKYREIGFETVGRFIDELEIALREIMPYYNQLMLTLDQDYNMLYNADYEKDVKTTRDGSGSTASKTTSEQSSVTDTEGSSTQHSSGSDSSSSEVSMADKSKTVHTDTPQNALSLPDKTRIEDVEFADAVQWEDKSSTSSTTTNGNTETDTTGTNTGKSTTTGDGAVTASGTTDMTESEEMHERIFGNYGQMSYQYLVAKYRELILNVEQRIINDRRIAELFMLIY